MEQFEVAFNDFLNHRIDEIFSKLKDEDQEYKASKKFIRNNIDKFENIIDKLPKEDRDFIEEYRNHNFNAVAQEQIYAYHCGYKDCVKLLKAIGVI